MLTGSFVRRVLPAGLLAGAFLLPMGCKKMTTETPAAAPAPTDQQITNGVQGRLNAEQALNGQNIQVTVNGGTVTLDGSVNNDAARALAAADSGAVTGVKTVINNLTVTPPVTAQHASPTPQERAARPARRKVRHTEQAQNVPAPMPPSGGDASPQPVAPPPPPQPVTRTVSIPAGTSLPVRITEGLSSQTAQAGQAIHGVLASDIITSNMIAIPRGTPVTGTVVDAKDAAHFSGSSRLSIALTSVRLDGQSVAVTTTPYTQEGKGRGTNTAVKTGGGAAIGAIIGALAGGGKGAAIGAASGGGLGAGVNAVTRGEQVKIPAETLVNFKLQAPVSVTTSQRAGGADVPTYNDDSQSQQPQDSQPQ